MIARNAQDAKHLVYKHMHEVSPFTSFSRRLLHQMFSNVQRRNIWKTMNRYLEMSWIQCMMTFESCLLTLYSDGCIKTIRRKNIIHRIVWTAILLRKSSRQSCIFFQQRDIDVDSDWEILYKCFNQPKEDTCHGQWLVDFV